MSRFFTKTRGFQTGFSLTELLVSLTIVTVLISVIVTSQSRYVDSAALTNLADELGLAAAQAQAYGIGVRQVSAGSSEFSASYGITASLLSEGSNAAYLFFADRNGNNAYDGTWACPVGGASECLEKKDFTRGNYIHELCAVRTSGADQCNNISRVDVSFKRPETSATLTFYNSSGNLYTPPNLNGAKITLRNQAGTLSRSVVVYLSGQISVQ